MPVHRDGTESITDQTYREIWNAIARYELPPGSVLVERNLCERFGHSRTAIREVLYRLDHEGVVERIPNHGAFVRKLTPREIVDIFSAREAVEGMAAHIAATRRPDDELATVEASFHDLDTAHAEGNLAPLTTAAGLLHDAVARWCANRSLQRAYNALRSEAMLIRALTQRDVLIKSPPPRVLEIEVASMKDHRMIIAALKARDGVAAEAAMRAHLRDTSRRIIAELVDFTT